jgi:hypothetical protein
MRFVTSLTVLFIAGTAVAGPALDDDKNATPAPAPAASGTDPTAAGGGAGTAAPTTEVTSPIGEKVSYGFDVRLRSEWVPQAVLGLFMKSSPGGAQSAGYGADFVRRRGDTELAFGIEYEKINLKQGVYVQSNSNVADGDTVDYILSPENAGSNFGWITLEFTFIGHKPFNKYVAFRYGIGAGLGILTGGVYRIDTQCKAGTTDDTASTGCIPPPYSTTSGTVSPDHPGDPEPGKYDLPPVFPVLNALVGFQFHPFGDHFVINLEGGLHTLPFVGLSAGALW